jgi:hypothetical protein
MRWKIGLAEVSVTDIIIIVIERKRHDEQHWIKPAPKTGNTEQQYRFFEGEEIGSWRVPGCSAARWLLDHGKGRRSDTLRTRRLIDGKEIPSMRGSIGWFADRTISETDGTPRFVKWTPMPEVTRGVARVGAGAPSDDEEAV